MVCGNLPQLADFVRLATPLARFGKIVRTASKQRVGSSNLPGRATFTNIYKTRSRLAEELSEQHVKVVDAILTLDRVAPAVVGGGAQAALHVFAETDVFLLDFVTEGNGSLNAFPTVFRNDVVKKTIRRW